MMPAVLIILSAFYAIIETLVRRRNDDSEIFSPENYQAVEIRFPTGIVGICVTPSQREANFDSLKCGGYKRGHAPFFNTLLLL